MKIGLIVLLYFFIYSGYSQDAILKVNQSTNIDETFQILNIKKITFSGLTSIKKEEQFKDVIKTFHVLKNYPNPFTNSTNIEFDIPDNGNVELSIFDINGKMIKCLLSEERQQGKHNVSWDCKDNSNNIVKAGTYYCNVVYKKQLINNKMILIK